MNEAERAIREALAAGPTPGPWHHCQPFQSVRAERTIHGPVPAQRVDFVSTKTQPVHERIIIPMAGEEAHVRSEDMAFIAACNPENIAALLAEIDRLTRERNEALGEIEAFAIENDTLRHQVIACGVAATHPDANLTRTGAYAGKWNSAQAESVRKLRAERDAMAKDAARYRYLRDDSAGFDISVREETDEGEKWVFGYPPTELDAAIDAQIEQERSEQAREGA